MVKCPVALPLWIPAFAGMTKGYGGNDVGAAGARASPCVRFAPRPPSLRERGDSHRAAPPSTVIIEPVTPLASSEAAKRKALARSSGIISRPIGVLERLPS